MSSWVSPSCHFERRGYDTINFRRITHLYVADEVSLFAVYQQRACYYVPLEDEGEWRDGDGGEGMAVDHEHVMAHAVVEGDLGDHVHAGITELQRDHGDVRLGLLEEVTAAGAHGE
jgi:hypothetical protein